MENETNKSEALQSPAAQQQHEQIAVLTADAERADGRATQAREMFQTICAQAAQALGLTPAMPQGQILQQALAASFQWGFQAADATDHAVQRREEVQLLAKIARASEDELLESRARRTKEVDLMERLVSAQEKMTTLTETQIKMSEHTLSAIKNTNEALSSLERVARSDGETKKDAASPGA